MTFFLKMTIPNKLVVKNKDFIMFTAINKGNRQKEITFFSSPTDGAIKNFIVKIKKQLIKACHCPLHYGTTGD